MGISVPIWKVLPMIRLTKSPLCKIRIYLLLILIGPALLSEMPEAITYWFGSYNEPSTDPVVANKLLALVPWGTYTRAQKISAAFWFAGTGTVMSNLPTVLVPCAAIEGTTIDPDWYRPFTNVCPLVTRQPLFSWDHREFVLVRLTDTRG